MGIEMVAEEVKQGTNTHTIKHFCKVCNKGFGCAGALGGHMRAHVTMGDVSIEHNHNNPPNGDQEKPEPPANNKHSYFLRAKTPRFMGYHVSDFEDGEYLRKSSSSLPFVKFALDKERVTPLLSSPSGSKSQYPDHHENHSASSEEEDLANCLVMLSNNKSCCNNNNNNEGNKAKEAAFEKGMFQCKACKKVFNSHQALGGHRASHKKVKGCFAAKMDINGPLDDEFEEEPTQDDHRHHNEHDVSMTPSSALEPSPTNTTSNTRKPTTKMHECSVCRRVFSSGQALGGHKRCHWLTTSADNAFIPNFHDFQYDDHHHHQSQQIYKKPMLTNPHHHERDLDNNHQDYYHDLDLNLNLPANVGDSRDTRIYLQKLTNHSQQRATETDNNSGKKGSCEMKLRKLSDLRDVNLDGGWLQVGIASTTDIY